jgi:hypothetical protein
MEAAMFDLSNPHTWELLTNLALVLVAFITMVYIGAGTFRKAIARGAARLTHAFRKDPHTLILHDLGITMADGGEKVHDAPPSGDANQVNGDAK